MSKQTINQTRRHLLKGAAYTSLLSMAGISNSAFAEIFSDSTCLASSEHTSCGLRIIQETLRDKESVTVINESGKIVMMNALQPITLTQQEGSLKVSINQSESDAVNGKILISDGDRISFDIKAIGINIDDTQNIPTLTNIAENELLMISENASFNRIVPVQLV